MIYHISSGVHKSIRQSFNEIIEAADEEEAKQMAEKLIDKLMTAINNELSNLSVERPTPSISLSDSNFTLKRGAIYLIRRYKRFEPAVVYSSSRRWWGGTDKDFQHEFKYVSNGKYFVIRGKKPDRLGKKLCDDGTVINKSECTNCVARFSCFTNKGGVV